jgi:hypothetical protein
VLSSGTAEVPPFERPSRAEPRKEQIEELLARCKGNLVRVHEELVAEGLSLSYPALTAFCRRHSIGHEPPRPAGHYDFGPGQEMQHDTSPHRATIAGVEQRVETASLVLCCSRMLFFQGYPAFNRFACKVFLTDALTYLQGAARVCMIDNTHVVVASGTGRDMVSAPEMAPSPNASASSSALTRRVTRTAPPGSSAPSASSRETSSPADPSPTSTTSTARPWTSATG